MVSCKTFKFRKFCHNLLLGLSEIIVFSFFCKDDAFISHCGPWKINNIPSPVIKRLLAAAEFVSRPKNLVFPKLIFLKFWNHENLPKKMVLRPNFDVRAKNSRKYRNFKCFKGNFTPRIEDIGQSLLSQTV